MRERFWEMLCDSLPLFALLFAANVVFLVLLALSWFFGDSDPETTYITMIALVPIGISLALSTYVIRRCRT